MPVALPAVGTTGRRTSALPFGHCYELSNKTQPEVKAAVNGILSKLSLLMKYMIQDLDFTRGLMQYIGSSVFPGPVLYVILAVKCRIDFGFLRTPAHPSAVSCSCRSQVDLQSRLCLLLATPFMTYMKHKIGVSFTQFTLSFSFGSPATCRPSFSALH